MKGFQAMNVNLSILVRRTQETVTIISVYVNDLLIASQTLQEVSHMKAVLNEAFEMSDLKEARVIVSFRVIRDQNKHTLTLNQASYIEEVLQEEGMQDCSPVEVPMKQGLFITLNEAGDSDEASLKNLQQIVEKLMYIACSTQPNIAFAVGCLNQNIMNPQAEHIKAVK